jgi:hypothetical protein
MFEKHKAHLAAEAAAAAAARRAQLTAYLETARNFDGHDAGSFPPVALKAGERGYFSVTGVALIEARRAAGHWEGHSQGVSIPVPGLHSVRYRVGATKGRFVPGPELPTAVDHGTFALTSRRAVFVGSAQTREWAWDKLIAVQHSEAQPWTDIAVSNRQKTSGILYDAAHAELVRFWIDFAVAKAMDGTDGLASELEQELAALPALPAPPASTG